MKTLIRFVLLSRRMGIINNDQFAMCYPIFHAVQAFYTCVVYLNRFVETRRKFIIGLTI